MLTVHKPYRHTSEGVYGEKKKEVLMLVAEKRMEQGMVRVCRCIYYVTQSLNIQDKCHKCATKIPIIEESRNGPKYYQYTVSHRNKEQSEHLTQMCNCNPYIVYYTIVIGIAVTLCRDCSYTM